MIVPLKPKLHSVQVLRFFAAFLVLIGHLFMEANKFDLIDDESYQILDMFPWGAGVDLFFIISGFIISHVIVSQQPSADSVKEFTIRRLIRIAPIYWFYTALMIVAIVFFSGLVEKTQLTAEHVIASFLFIPWPNQHEILQPVLSQGWTLNYEMLFYIVSACALLFANSSRKYYMSTAILALFLLGQVFQDQHFIFSFFADTVILEFLLGIWLYELYTRVPTIPAAASFLLIAIGIALWLMGEMYLSDNEYRVIARGIPAFLISAAIIMSGRFQTNTGLVNRGFGLLGDASYSLYLCHPFVLVPFAYFWKQTGLSSLPLFLIIAISASVMASLISYLLIEKNMLRILHKATNTRKGQAA